MPQEGYPVEAIDAAVAWWTTQVRGPLPGGPGEGGPPGQANDMLLAASAIVREEEEVSEEQARRFADTLRSEIISAIREHRSLGERGVYFMTQSNRSAVCVSMDFRPDPVLNAALEASSLPYLLLPFQSRTWITADYTAAVLGDDLSTMSVIWIAPGPYPVCTVHIDAAGAPCGKRVLHTGAHEPESSEAAFAEGERSGPGSGSPHQQHRAETESRLSTLFHFWDHEPDSWQRARLTGQVLVVWVARDQPPPEGEASYPVWALVALAAWREAVVRGTTVDLVPLAAVRTRLSGEVAALLDGELPQLPSDGADDWAQVARQRDLAVIAARHAVDAHCAEADAQLAAAGATAGIAAPDLARLTLADRVIDLGARHKCWRETLAALDRNLDALASAYPPAVPVGHGAGSRAGERSTLDGQRDWLERLHACHRLRAAAGDRTNAVIFRPRPQQHGDAYRLGVEVLFTLQSVCERPAEAFTHLTTYAPIPEPDPRAWALLHVSAEMRDLVDALAIRTRRVEELFRALAGPVGGPLFEPPTLAVP
jgi:hypothetical protein